MPINPFSSLFPYESKTKQYLKEEVEGGTTKHISMTKKGMKDISISHLLPFPSSAPLRPRFTLITLGETPQSTLERQIAVLCSPHCYSLSPQPQYKSARHILSTFSCFPVTTRLDVERPEMSARGVQPFSLELEIAICISPGFGSH